MLTCVSRHSMNYPLPGSFFSCAFLTHSSQLVCSTPYQWQEMNWIIFDRSNPSLMNVIHLKTYKTSMIMSSGCFGWKQQNVFNFKMIYALWSASLWHSSLSITMIRRLCLGCEVALCYNTPRTVNNFSLLVIIREFTKGVNGTVGEECTHKNFFLSPSIIYGVTAEEVGSVHVSFILDCIFDSVFHVSLNSCNTKLKNGGDRWGSLHTRITLHVSFKAMYFVL